LESPKVTTTTKIESLSVLTAIFMDTWQRTIENQTKED